MARGAGTVGGISVNVTANTAKFGKNITAARKLLGKFSSSVTSTVFSMKSLAAAAAGGLLAKFTSDQAATIDKLMDMSAQLGITTEALAGLRLAADENGSSMEDMEAGLQKMIRTIAAAGQGNNKAAAAFERIGLSVEYLKSLSPDQQFAEIAGAVAQLKNRTDQLNATYDIFGKGAGSLVGVLREGKDGMLEARDAAINLGLAVSEESAAGVGSAIDAFNRLKSSISAIFSNIAIEIAPYIELMSTAFTDFLTKGEGVKGLAKSLAQGAIEAIKFMADLGQQAFTALLRAAAAIKDMMNDVRGSYLGSAAGLSPATMDDKVDVAILQLMAANMGRIAVSSKIDSAVSGIKSGTAAKIQEKQLAALESIDGRLKTSPQTQLASASINK